jgi:hypothetical protein|tara:strand:+ start:240 stop:491 length:252 start_codon:yes stop_codon:yes gene_type:complete
MLQKSMLDAFVKDYSWFIAFVVLGGIWVYFGRRKAKWCPKCKKPSCEKLGPKSNTDMQAMRCKFCGFNKTIYTPSNNPSLPPD